MKSTHHLLFKDIALNQKKKIDHWIHHIKTIGNNNFLSIIYMLSHIKVISTVTKSLFQLKTFINLLFENLELNQK